MNDLVKIDMTEYALEPSVADNIKMIFAPMVEGLKKFEGDYDTVIALAQKEVTTDVCAQAKRLRLDIGKVRIEAEKARKKEKEQYLRGGRAVDGVNNILKFAIADKEENLKKIEQHFELLELAKREEIAVERRAELDKYGFDHSRLDLVVMPEDIWEYTLQGVKSTYELEQDAIKKAEEARIANEKAVAEEQARIRAENEKLRQEAEAREKQARIDREKREAEEAVRREEEAKREAEHQEQLRVEREAREKIEAEAREKREAEEAQREADEEAKLKAEQAPDKEKIVALIDSLSAVEKPQMDSVKGREVVEEVFSAIQKIKTDLIDVHKVF